MNKKEKIILAVLGVLVLAAAITVAVLAGNRQPQYVQGQFTPPPFAEGTVVGTPENLDPALGYGTLNLDGSAVSLCANTTIVNGKAQLYLTNAADNIGWVRIKLYSADGTQLGQSGLVRPGEYIRWIDLDTVPGSAGLAVIKIMLYEPETYYSLGSATAQVMLLPQ